jgi:Domain of unknown function (DUF2017)
VAQVLRRRGRIQVRLNGQEREALLGIVADLSPSLAEVRAATGRAYDEPELQSEFARWVQPESDHDCEADVEVVRDSLAAGEDTLPLTEAQALCWLRALNYLRLAAGRVLGVTDDNWMDAVDDKTRQSREFGVLMALGYIQEELVAALES